MRELSTFALVPVDGQSKVVVEEIDEDIRIDKSPVHQSDKTLLFGHDHLHCIPLFPPESKR